jgi:flagellar hook-length control protein FliK
VERHEAHAFLNNELPALHQALNDRQLHLERVSVDQGSPDAWSGTAAGGSGQQQSQNGSPQRSPYSFSGAHEQVSSALMNSTFADTTDVIDTRVTFDSDGRLSVRA